MASGQQQFFLPESCEHSGIFIYRIVCSDCVTDVYDFSSSALSKDARFHWQFSQRPRGDHVLTINSLHGLGGTCNVRTEIYVMYIVLCLFLFVIFIYIPSVEN